MGGLPFLRGTAIPAVTASASAAGRPAPRVVAMVPVCLSSDAAGARTALNTTYAMYGQLPSYRATLDRGGAQDPADVAVIGDESQVIASLREFEAAGVTDFVAVLTNSPATNAAATSELLGRLAREGVR
jgi:alkanesulfonate monooxygenase SsuD/methylene tetrahydromethanopterin reductase-like flavin-dependent oxidoreductase (luciferase family)